MKSAYECFLHATKCEQMAKETLNQSSRKMLRTTAQYWRTLGNEAKAKEPSEAKPDKQSI